MSFISFKSLSKLTDCKALICLAWGKVASNIVYQNISNYSQSRGECPLSYNNRMQLHVNLTTIKIPPINKRKDRPRQALFQNQLNAEKVICCHSPLCFLSILYLTFNNEIELLSKDPLITLGLTPRTLHIKSWGIVTVCNWSATVRSHSSATDMNCHSENMTIL